MKKTSRLSRVIFKVTRFFVRLFYGKTEIEGLENIPRSNAVIVSNHAQMNGPIVAELFMPSNCYIWCAGEMLDRKAVPEYAFKDFWSEKPKRTHAFYRLLARLMAPLAECLFKNARTIPVYHDSRIVTTFKETVVALNEGKTVLIFPEKKEPLNNVINTVQENFVDVAKLYFKKFGKDLIFVPMYIAPKMRKIFVGKGISYNGEAPAAEEKTRITEYLTAEITRIARELPPHTVVPYENIPAKYYLSNKDVTQVPSRHS